MRLVVRQGARALALSSMLLAAVACSKSEPTTSQPLVTDVDHEQRPFPQVRRPYPRVHRGGTRTANHHAARSATRSNAAPSNPSSSPKSESP